MADKNVFVQKVKALEKEIKQLKNSENYELKNAREELESFGLISSYAGVALYADRVVGGDSKPLRLDSGVQAAIQTGGQVWTTTDVKGGGSRPTLTRIGVGALVAGPVGALIGGAAQKKKKITTDVQVHDDRTLRLVISSRDGYIDVAGYPDDESGARDFVSSIMNAVADYPKVKGTLKPKHDALKKKVAELENSDELNKKEKELSRLVDDASESDKEELKKHNKNRKVKIWLIAIGIFLALWVITYANDKDQNSQGTEESAKPATPELTRCLDVPLTTTTAGYTADWSSFRELEVIDDVNNEYYDGIIVKAAAVKSEKPFWNGTGYFMSLLVSKPDGGTGIFTLFVSNISRPFAGINTSANQLARDNFDFPWSDSTATPATMSDDGAELSQECLK